ASRRSLFPCTTLFRSGAVDLDRPEALVSRGRQHIAAGVVAALGGERREDAVPCAAIAAGAGEFAALLFQHLEVALHLADRRDDRDRKSTRLNSSHVKI